VYLERALNDYAIGLRQSGTMQPQAVALEDKERAAIAEYYARSAKQERQTPAPADQVERGRRIANDGVTREGIPACLECHGARGKTSFPRLAGQSARYLAQQLNLWRAGHRAQTAQGAIMAPIAIRLSDRQIEDVASYFESRRPSEDLPRPDVEVSRGAR
jgi:cytochrome c553